MLLVLEAVTWRAKKTVPKHGNNQSSNHNGKRPKTETTTDGSTSSVTNPADETLRDKEERPYILEKYSYIKRELQRHTVLFDSTATILRTTRANPPLTSHNVFGRKTGKNIAKHNQKHKSAGIKLSGKWLASETSTIKMKTLSNYLFYNAKSFIKTTPPVKTVGVNELQPPSTILMWHSSFKRCTAWILSNLKPQSFRRQRGHNHGVPMMYSTSTVYDVPATIAMFINLPEATLRNIDRNNIANWNHYRSQQRNFEQRNHQQHQRKPF